MENNTNIDVNTNTQDGGQKTFTQDDVNRIVQDRLAKDRAKASEELNRREQELKDKEFRLDSRQKLIDRGYPESIMDALNCSNTEAFDKALDIIDSLIKDRTPAATDPELEKNKAKFTTNISVGGSFADKKDDLIKKAMGMI